MTSSFPEHTSANYFLHSGLGLQGRPSMGAWVTYGLGSLNEELPGYVVLNGGQIPSGGLDNFSSGFLPASFQGSLFQAKGTPVANVIPSEKTAGLQEAKRRLVKKLNQQSLADTGGSDALESAIANYELAARMQVTIPELMDLSGETEATKKLYGLDAEYEHTRTYARECILARRLVERGVRFIELTIPTVAGADRWDAHSNLLKNHGDNARAVDQPIAALLQDLKQRGLLDHTLVLWAGEFGRTPFAQGSDGRDHNEFAFTVWMAGAGVKPGCAYGGTDDWGYRAVTDPLDMHDLHATILHLLGLDHTKLTYRFSGRDIRLTDVSGSVIREILTCLLSTSGGPFQMSRNESSRRRDCWSVARQFFLLFSAPVQFLAGECDRSPARAFASAAPRGRAGGSFLSGRTHASRQPGFLPAGRRFRTSRGVSGWAMSEFSISL